jgi:hypothetical protein
VNNGILTAYTRLSNIPVPTMRLTIRVTIVLVVSNADFILVSYGTTTKVRVKKKGDLVSGITHIECQ